MLVIFSFMCAIVCFRAAEWCLNKRRRALQIALWLLLTAMAMGIVYGLLRLTGAVLFPGDNTYSVNFFDASWRDDGARVLLACGAPFVAISAAPVRDGKSG